MPHKRGLVEYRRTGVGRSCAKNAVGDPQSKNAESFNTEVSFSARRVCSPEDEDAVTVRSTRDAAWRPY